MSSKINALISLYFTSERFMYSLAMRLKLGIYCLMLLAGCILDQGAAMLSEER